MKREKSKFSHHRIPHTTFMSDHREVVYPKLLILLRKKICYHRKVIVNFLFYRCMSILFDNIIVQYILNADREKYNLMNICKVKSFIIESK